MPRKLGQTVRSTLTTAPLPSATKSYTVISHSFAINTILKNLNDHQFQVKDEEYKSTTDAQIACGTFIIDYQDDPDLTMSYSFSNSYDKTMKFKAAVGAKVSINGAYMINETTSWKRKHTGTAVQEAEALIKSHISTAGSYYDTLKQAKNSMMLIEINAIEMGKIVGDLFFRGFLTIDQVSLIKKEYESPSFKYTTDKNNLWTCYNHIIYALKSSHPLKWLQNQAAIHLYFVSTYDLCKFDEEPIDESELIEEENSTEITEVVIDNEVVPAIPGILEQVEESVILPGFEPEITNSVKEAPEEEYQDPNQLDLEEVIAEVTTSQIEEPVSIDNPISTDTPGIFFVSSDYPELVEGDVFQEGDTYYKICRFEDIDGVTYMVCEIISFDEDPITEEPPANNIPDEVPDENVENIPDPFIEDLINTEEQVSNSNEASNIEVPLEDYIKETAPTPQDVQQDFIKDAIASELTEIYGYAPVFTYELSEDQYNVTLETSETLVFAASYINSKI
jgi:hypothetical protein